MSTAAYDPTYTNAAWTVQSNAAASGGTGPSHMGAVAGLLGYTSSTVNGIAQGKTGGAAGPMSATAAEPSGSGAVSVKHEKTIIIGNIPPSHSGDARQGVY